MEAIESVRQQTYTHWEIVLVDDASTDNSKQLYKDLEKDERIHIYYNEQNMGCGYTKRRCAELAQGEICGFLDPDDALTKDALAIMIDAHAEHPEASLINATYYIANADLQILSISSNECQIPSGSSFLENGRGISVFAAYKKAYYNKTIGIRSDFRRAVDHYLYYLLEEVGNVIYIDKPLYIYRQNTGNNISLQENAEKAYFWHLLAMIDACNRRHLDIESIVYRELKTYIDDCEDRGYVNGQHKVYQSYSYKVGKKIVQPVKRIRDVVNAILHK